MSSNGSVHCSTCRSSSCCPRTASRQTVRRSSACFPDATPLYLLSDATIAGHRGQQGPRQQGPAGRSSRSGFVLLALAADDRAGGLAVGVAVAPVAGHECSVAPKVGAHVLILDVP